MNFFGFFITEEIRATSFWPTRSIASLAIARIFFRLLSINSAFWNKDAPVLAIASQSFWHFQKVLFMLLLRAFSHAVLTRQPLFSHFLSKFFYTQDMCSLRFGITFGISISLPS